MQGATIMAITVGCLASAALVAAVAVVAVRIRRWQLAARPPVRLVRLVSWRPVRVLARRRSRAIEAACT